MDETVDGLIDLIHLLVESAYKEGVKFGEKPVTNKVKGMALAYADEVALRLKEAFNRSKEHPDDEIA